MSTRARCRLYSGVAFRSPGGSVPSAACSAAAAMRLRRASPPFSASSTAVARSGVEPMWVRPDPHVLARAAVDLDQGRHADHRPVLGAAGELLVAEPSRPATGADRASAPRRAPAPSSGSPGRGPRPRSSRSPPGPGGRTSPSSASSTRAGRTPGRRGRASRRSCRGCAPAGRRSAPPPADHAELVAVLERRVAGERADPHAAVRALDAAQLGDAADVDQQRRRRQAQLHQRQQRVAAGQQLRVLAALARAAAIASSTDSARA